jgi:signal transduction histidine kinase
MLLWPLQTGSCAFHLLGLKHNLGLLVPTVTYTKVAETKAHRPNIVIHMGAVIWALKQIVADGHRAGAMIGTIRASFKKDVPNRAPLDVNELIEGALALVRGNLQKHRILVQAEPNAQAPQVIGDRIQLQQVLLNLITNAIESMAAKDEPRVLCVKSDVHDGGGVKVSVADTGTGIGSHDIDRIFDPLFTTKSDSMGMGLSICRSIIEAHDGRIWVAPNKPQGAVFQFVLPADGATSAGAFTRRATRRSSA